MEVNGLKLNSTHTSALCDLEESRRYYHVNHRDALAEAAIDKAVYYLWGLTGAKPNFDAVQELMKEASALYHD